MRENNGGCAGFIMNFIAVLVINVIINFLSQNTLMMIIGYAGYFGSAGAALFMATLLVVPAMIVMGCVQWSLRKANYLATFFLLLIPIVICANISLLHVGLMYSVLILIWSVFTAKRED
jgi:hypothetical protein